MRPIRALATALLVGSMLQGIKERVAEGPSGRGPVDLGCTTAGAADSGLGSGFAMWEPVAVVAAAVGFVVLIPYWLAAGHAGESNPEFNVLIHALGNVGVLVLLLVPSLEHWLVWTDGIEQA